MTPHQPCRPPGGSRGKSNRGAVFPAGAAENPPFRRPRPRFPLPPCPLPPERAVFVGVLGQKNLRPNARFLLTWRPRRAIVITSTQDRVDPGDSGTIESDAGPAATKNDNDNISDSDQHHLPHPPPHRRGQLPPDRDRRGRSRTPARRIPVLLYHPRRHDHQASLRLQPPRLEQHGLSLFDALRRGRCRVDRGRNHTRRLAQTQPGQSAQPGYLTRPKLACIRQASLRVRRGLMRPQHGACRAATDNRGRKSETKQHANPGEH